MRATGNVFSVCVCVCVTVCVCVLVCVCVYLCFCACISLYIYTAIRMIIDIVLSTSTYRKFSRARTASGYGKVLARTTPILKEKSRGEKRGGGVRNGEVKVGEESREEEGSRIKR